MARSSPTGSTSWADRNRHSADVRRHAPQGRLAARPVDDLQAGQLGAAGEQPVGFPHYALAPHATAVTEHVIVDRNYPLAGSKYPR
jgi:hypothetical protein